NHGVEVKRQTPQQIVDQILELEEGTRFQVLAPVVRGRKGEYADLLKDLGTQGFARARIDGEGRDMSEDILLYRNYQPTIEGVCECEASTWLKDTGTQGFARARIDGAVRDLPADFRLDRYYQQTIEVVVERLVRKEGIEQRLTQSLETALTLTGGVVDIDIVDGPNLTFSQSLACPAGDSSFEDLPPRTFSFHTP